MSSIFKDLIALYPTWNELHKYLESDEGGRFRVVDKKEDMCLIRYQKGVSRMDLPHSKWFRSIVWNTVTNVPISVAPPKVSYNDIPFSTLKELSDANIYCQEQMDGFMINCFRKVGDETLYITSRSKLDAAGHFYSSKSFRQLFIEAYMKTEFDEELETVFQTYSKDMESPDISKNEVSICYSFLVQHIAHRIVTPIHENKLFLVHKATVYSDGIISMNDSNPQCGNHFTIPSIPLELNLQFSKDESLSQVFYDSEIVNWVKNMFKTKTWEFQGVVFKDDKGNRWRFRNDKYSLVKALRGNSATSLERFAQLYTQNLIYHYLQYYPDENFYFSCHTIFMNMVIEHVYHDYIELYVTKNITKNNVNKMYIPHLYSLHNLYITSLRQHNKKITPEQITLYFHNQPWQRIAFLIKKCQDEYFTQMENVVNSA